MCNRIALQVAEMVGAAEMATAQMLGYSVQEAIESSFRALDEAYGLALEADRPMLTLPMRMIRT